MCEAFSSALCFQEPLNTAHTWPRHNTPVLASPMHYIDIKREKWFFKHSNTHWFCTILALKVHIQLLYPCERDLGLSCKKQNQGREGQKKYLSINTLSLSVQETYCLWPHSRSLLPNPNQSCVFLLAPTKPQGSAVEMHFSEIHKNFSNTLSRQHCSRTRQEENVRQKFHAF